MQYYGDTFTYLQSLWLRFIDFLPQLVGAIIVLILGWIIAAIVAMVVRRIVQFTGIDGWVKRTGLNERLRLRDGSNYALVSNFVASVVKWVIILGTVGLAADMLGLAGVRAFTGTILAYIPNVIVAVVILSIGMIAAQFAAEFVSAGAASTQMPGANRKILAAVARYSIMVFAIMAALTQLNIVPQLIEIAFAGLVFALALAFGMGGREHASRWIEQLRSRTQ